MENNRFCIDFFEFSFLVEACIPPRPIARAMFWQEVIDKYYHVLTSNERSRLYGWICRNSSFDINNEDCALFAARYNPANQVKVKTFYNGKEDTLDCFKWKNRYHTAKNTFIANEYISSVVENVKFEAVED